MAKTQPLGRRRAFSDLSVLLCAILFICSAMAAPDLSTYKEPSLQDNLEHRLEGLKETLMETLMQRIDQQNEKLLKDQIESNRQQSEAMAAKMSQLEDQMASLIRALQHANDQETKPIPNNLTLIDQLVIDGRMNGAPFRTCHETRLSDLTLGSGMYWIDPDGQGMGDDPIYVYCDMETGSTGIPHNSEEVINVGHCLDPGCYSRKIVNSATSKQIKTLIDLSTECHQSIRYDCNNAPFILDGTTYSWWNDRNGNIQTFWAGSGSNGHTCQCGIDGNCVDLRLPCNCDSLIPLPLTDIGVITNKNYLPISQLNFGRTQLSTSSGEHTLGRLVCSGAVAVNRIPTSCEDLWRIGHQLRGIYLIKGEKSIDMVYCDFSKQLTDSNFQKWYGQVAVTSSPVYFEAQRSYDTSDRGTLNYDYVPVNVGGAMNGESGIFTASQKGTHFFIFSGYAVYTESRTASLTIELMAANRPIGHTTFNVNKDDHNGDSVAIQSIVDLNVGDQVYVTITGVNEAKLIDSSYNHFTHFSGGLLRQETVVV